jgi:hypothetical protein
VVHIFLVLDAANDLAILLVPIRTAFTLQMALRAKVGLAGVFALGGFVVVTNVVRIVEFYTRRKEDPNESRSSLASTLMVLVLTLSSFLSCHGTLDQRPCLYCDFVCLFAHLQAAVDFALDKGQDEGYGDTQIQ